MYTHTAGKLTVRQEDEGVPKHRLVGEDGYEVAYIRVVTARNDKEDEANAEHLALCWNSYEGFVAALGSAKAALATCGLGGSNGRLERQVEKQIDTALAAAKGSASPNA